MNKFSIVFWLLLFLPTGFLLGHEFTHAILTINGGGSLSHICVETFGLMPSIACPIQPKAYWGLLENTRPPAGVFVYDAPSYASSELYANIGGVMLVGLLVFGSIFLDKLFNKKTYNKKDVVVLGYQSKWNA